MKKFLFILLVVLSFSNVQAQYTCNTALPFLSMVPDTLEMPTSTVAPVGPNYGCLGSQPNPMYYALNVCTGGSFDIDIFSLNNSDIDFIAWGPFYSTDLNQICSDIASGATGSGIDCSYSTSSIEQINIPNAMTGETYIIMIVNYASQVDTLVINQVGGSGIADTSLNCTSGNPYCGIYNLPVCEVTMNDSATHCKVMWEKIQGLAVDYYSIYRLSPSNTYDLIDLVFENDSSFYVDNSSNPNQQSYRYKINYTDTCGNVNNLSGFHQSIHLQASPGFNAINLSWTNYIGLNFPTYFIFRGTDPFNMNLLDSVAGVFTTYTDLNPDPLEPYYQVGIVNPDPCVITRNNLGYTVSNVFAQYPVGIDEYAAINYSLYPNPARDLITIELFNGNSVLKTLSIFDIAGKMIVAHPVNIEKTSFDISNLEDGMYIYHISENGHQVASGKMVIE